MTNYQEEIEIIAEEFETEHDLKVLNECWHISAHTYEDDLQQDIEPQTWFEGLKKIGSIKNIRVIHDAARAGKGSKKKYTGFEIDLKCDKLKKEIDEYFDQLRDSYRIRILSPNSNISDYIELIEELSDKDLRIGEILKEIGSLTDSELEEVLKIQSEYAGENNNTVKERPPIGELLVQEKMVHDTVLRAALEKQEKLREE